MPRRCIATTDTAVAVTSLQPCRSAVLTARLDALAAATRLAGARAARARQLADQISDPLGHLPRLIGVLDDNEFDEIACGGWAPCAHYER